MIRRGRRSPGLNPSDVAPDSEDTIIRLGKRVIEEGEIEPYMRKKGYSENDE
jgi:hypothetical protein